jgi:hypothetical protein
MASSDGPDYSQIADDIGLTTLRAEDPSLTGAGITVGQVEGSSSGTQGGIDFEVDPASLGQPADNSNDFITYWSGTASTSTYNDGIIGTFSNHATVQAGYFYNPTLYLGAPEGVAPGVAHVDNYNADDFLENLAAGPLPDAVVNLSVLYTGDDSVDDAFDAAANQYGTVFVAAAGNGGTPGMPSSAYNVISVDTWPGVQAVGPAGDGTPKPDICAPQTVTSRTTAIVSGVATLLVQAAQDGIGGASPAAIADAQDFRTIKALLLNGADKPADYYTTSYAPTDGQPLNAVYGAGIVNAANSVATLAAGEQGASADYRIVAGAAPYQPLFTAVLPNQGWDLSSVSAWPGQDGVQAYAVDLAAGIGFTATLTWAANDLDQIDHLSLYLYDDATGALVASGTSAVSNVQQFMTTPAVAGQYDLEVVLRGGSVAAADTYALAYAEGTSLACFAAGTRILTVDGEVAIDALRPGTTVVTADGRLAPLEFLGRRRASRDAPPAIRIRRDAFGPGVPLRDLVVSPDHAVALRDGEGVALVNAAHLVNGANVRTEPQAARVYWHLALDRHAIVFAEGLAVESYLDTGNLADFDNAGEAPANLPRHPCAPLLTGGTRLAALHARLLARAGRPADDPEPLLRADDAWIAPCYRGPGFARFRLPQVAGSVTLVSRIAIPAEFGGADGRRLGLPVQRLALGGRPVALERLDGPYPAEGTAPLRWRWTDGSARLDLPAWAAGDFEVWWRPDWLRYWPGSALSRTPRPRASPRR